MLPTFMLARDHLERAAAMLQGTDSRSQQVRHIIERTIGLMDDVDDVIPVQNGNVLNLEAFRRTRQGWA